MRAHKLSPFAQGHVKPRPARLVPSTHKMSVIRRDSLSSFSSKRCPNLRFVRLVSLYDVSFSERPHLQFWS